MNTPSRQRLKERQALEELQRLRPALFRDMARLTRRESNDRAERGDRGRDRQGRNRRGGEQSRAHKCCKREWNQMRISPLEAHDIATAFRNEPELRRRLPAVRARLNEELKLLTDNAERQNFECPLLEGTRCLVHEVAKPIGCLAWNEGEEYTSVAWNAFRRRDEINDRIYGEDWKLRAIPLWLKRVFGNRSSAKAGTSGSADRRTQRPRNLQGTGRRRTDRRGAGRGRAPEDGSRSDGRRRQEGGERGARGERPAARPRKPGISRDSRRSKRGDRRR